MVGPGTSDPLSYAACGIEGVQEFRGSLDGAGLSVGVVAGRFNIGLTRSLVQGVITALVERGTAPESVTLIWVPGTFEVPSVLERLAAAGAQDVLIGIGAVIEGQTSHAASIVDAVTSAFCDIGRRYTVPVIDGVVAAPSYEIADARCAPGPDSRAPYLAEAAIEIAHVFRRLSGTTSS